MLTDLRNWTDRHPFTSVLLALFFLVTLVPLASANEPGRMTGGGSIACGDFGKVTHGFELHCISPTGSTPDEPNSLEINWENGNNFHLTTLTFSFCSDNPLFNEGQPVAGFDTMHMKGTGSFNNVPGATIDATLIDDGEPGAGHDLARYQIKDNTGTIVLDCPFTVLDEGGNHQAHKLNGP